MTRTQKLIKYFALAIAASLIVAIISTIFMGLNTFSALLDLNGSVAKDLEIIQLSDDIVNSLDIDLKRTKLEIISGKKLKVQSNNSNIKVTHKNGILKILEKNNIFKNSFKNTKLMIYLPEDNELEHIEIESGAGSVEIKSIKSQEIELDMGAGSASLEGLTIENQTEISGGTGSITIKSSKLNNLSLEVGVGATKLNAHLTGNSNIESGIGSVDINLLSDIENYLINIEKGIGSIKIDGKKITSPSYGNGNNIIKIEAGIGSVNINTKKES